MSHVRATLCCLPYAAGSVGAFRGWAEFLPSTVELLPMEPPGRGKRFGEPLLDSVELIADDLLPAVLDVSGPVALFGHSLGALVAFELAHRLRAHRREPLVLLASGSRAPHLGPVDPASALAGEEFRERLGELNGTPKEVLENDELMELMLPVLRADFVAADGYRCPPREPLDCPIVAFGGTADPEVDAPALLGWADHTAGAFEAHVFSGDHFFLHSKRDQLLEEVGLQLARLLSEIRTGEGALRT
jgi:medium-chain acyl-[acyl-carrier-protein] hydrolase